MSLKVVDFTNTFLERVVQVSLQHEVFISAVILLHKLLLKRNLICHIPHHNNQLIHPLYLHLTLLQNHCPVVNPHQIRIRKLDVKHGRVNLKCLHDFLKCQNTRAQLSHTD